MNVILLQDVETLGTAGDIVKVKPGYARNYLFPRGFALRSSNRNRAVAEEKKRNVEMRAKRLEQANQSLANKISKTELTFEMQVGEEEKNVWHCNDKGYPGCFGRERNFYRQKCANVRRIN